METTKTTQELLKAVAEGVKQITAEALIHAQRAKEAAVRIIWMETRLAKDGASNTLAANKIGKEVADTYVIAEEAADAAAEATGIYYQLTQEYLWEGCSPDTTEVELNKLLKKATEQMRKATKRRWLAEEHEHTAQWWYEATTKQPQGWHSDIETTSDYIINATDLDPTKL